MASCCHILNASFVSFVSFDVAAGSAGSAGLHCQEKEATIQRCQQLQGKLRGEAFGRTWKIHKQMDISAVVIKPEDCRYTLDVARLPNSPHTNRTQLDHQHSARPGSTYLNL